MTNLDVERSLRSALRQANTEANRLREANADMLAALKEVVGPDYCEQRHPSGQAYVGKGAITKVRAAIAKAEGRGRGGTEENAQ